MNIATNEYINNIDALAEKRRQEILGRPDTINVEGTKYYVSADGNDSNDGLTEATAWKTIACVNSANSSLKPGDGVFFRRGDIFRGMLFCAEGVTYAAYGQGEKPRIYAADRALDDPELWIEVDSVNHIYRWAEPILDVGTIVFNDGERHSYKHIPTYKDGRYVCRDNEEKPFDISQELTGDLDLFWYYDAVMTHRPSRGADFPVPDLCYNKFGTLYLRSDKGNPALVYNSIEAVVRRHGIKVGKCNNVRIDNLAVKYVAEHGISAGGDCVRGLQVTGCEFGWIGGSIQNYLGLDPNYPEGGRGTVTRYGNAIEIYGGCDNYKVEDCYIYQCYDAGITHQITTNGKKYELTNITYKNNLVEYCVYSIEYFLDQTDGDNDSYMDGVEICGNILRHSGYGWGQQRHNKHTPAHIKGWSYVNTAKNYTVHHNVFDRAAYRMLHLVALKEESCPEMHDNVYIQHKGGMIGQYGGNELGEPDILCMDENADVTIHYVFSDENAEIYVIE